jgi:hypothetical protein
MFVVAPPLPRFKLRIKAVAPPLSIKNLPIFTSKFHNPLTFTPTFPATYTCKVFLGTCKNFTGAFWNFYGTCKNFIGACINFTGACKMFSGAYRNFSCACKKLSCPCRNSTSTCSEILRHIKKVKQQYKIFSFSKKIFIKQGQYFKVAFIQFTNSLM